MIPLILATAYCVLRQRTLFDRPRPWPRFLRKNSSFLFPLSGLFLTLHKNNLLSKQHQDLDEEGRVTKTYCIIRKSVYNSPSHMHHRYGVWTTWGHHHYQERFKPLFLFFFLFVFFFFSRIVDFKTRVGFRLGRGLVMMVTARDWQDSVGPCYGLVGPSQVWNRFGSRVPHALFGLDRSFG